jgi:hypothetical protein
VTTQEVFIMTVKERTKNIQERFVVLEYNKRTHKKEVVFEATSKTKCEKKAANLNDSLTPHRREKIEYRCQRGTPYRRVTVGH